MGAIGIILYTGPLVGLLGAFAFAFAFGLQLRALAIVGALAMGISGLGLAFVYGRGNLHDVVHAGLPLVIAGILGAYCAWSSKT